MRIAILGAGITGLTAGRLLRAAGHGVVLFEALDRPGGLIRSEVVDGFTLDLAGGHVFFTRDQEVLQYVVDLMGEDNLVKTHRNTKIYYRGRYVHYPFENGLGDLPPEDNFACLKGYVEAHIARRSGAAPAPVNFREWILWRFGPGIAEKFMVPYNEKLWKTDLSAMGFRWVEGRVPDAPMDDVLRSAVGIRTEGYTHQALFRYPRRGGYGAIAERSARDLEGCIRFETPARQVRKAARGFEVNGEAFDALISTISIPDLLRVLEGADPELVSAGTSLRTLSLATFLIGLDHPSRFPYSWVYLPHPENGPCNRITHLSNYSPENAPPGRSSVMAELTFSGKPEVTDATVEQVVAGLENCGIVRRRSIVLLTHRTVERAYAVYDHGFEERLERARAGLDALGIVTVGRFGRFEYHNADQCIRRAIDAVKGLGVRTPLGS